MRDGERERERGNTKVDRGIGTGALLVSPFVTGGLWIDRERVNSRRPAELSLAPLLACIHSGVYSWRYYYYY